MLSCSHFIAASFNEYSPGEISRYFRNKTGSIFWTEEIQNEPRPLAVAWHRLDLRNRAVFRVYVLLLFQKYGRIQSIRLSNTHRRIQNDNLGRATFVWQGRDAIDSSAPVGELAPFAYLLRNRSLPILSLKGHCTGLELKIKSGKHFYAR